MALSFISFLPIGCHNPKEFIAKKFMIPGDKNCRDDKVANRPIHRVSANVNIPSEHKQVRIGLGRVEIEIEFVECPRILSGILVSSRIELEMKIAHDCDFHCDSLT